MTTNTNTSNINLIKLVLAEVRKNLGDNAASISDEDINIFAEFGDQLSQGKICLKEALKIPKSQMDMFYAMAYDFYQRNKYEKAETLFSLLTFCDPMEEKYWEGLGATQKQLKKLDLAIAAYGMLTQIRAKCATYYLDLAECFFLRKQFKEAAQCCEAMLFMAESFPESNPNIGNQIQKTKLLLKALNKKLEE